VAESRDGVAVGDSEGSAAPAPAISASAAVAAVADVPPSATVPSTRWRFYAFDAYCVTGHQLVLAPFDQRRRALCEHVFAGRDAWLGSVTDGALTPPPPPFQLVYKPYWKVSEGGIDTALALNKAPRRFPGSDAAVGRGMPPDSPLLGAAVGHPIDGLMFVVNSAVVEPGNRPAMVANRAVQPLVKWKMPSENTIDFVCKVVRTRTIDTPKSQGVGGRAGVGSAGAGAGVGGGGGGGSGHDGSSAALLVDSADTSPEEAAHSTIAAAAAAAPAEAVLFVIDDGALVEFKHSKLHGGPGIPARLEPVDEPRVAQLDGKIVECTFVPATRRYRVLRLREDKTLPNGWKTATRVADTIFAPVTEQHLRDRFV
jgi:hypothetical protein